MPKLIQETQQLLDDAKVDSAATKIGIVKQMCPRSQAVNELAELVAEAVGRRDELAQDVRALIALGDFSAALGAVDQSLKEFPQDLTLLAIRRDAVDKPAMISARHDEVTKHLNEAQFESATRELKSLLRVCPNAPAMQRLADHVSQVQRKYPDLKSSSQQQLSRAQFTQAQKDADAARALCPDSVWAQTFARTIAQSARQYPALVAEGKDKLDQASFSEARDKFEKTRAVCPDAAEVLRLQASLPPTVSYTHLTLPTICSV